MVSAEWEEGPGGFLFSLLGFEKSGEERERESCVYVCGDAKRMMND